MIQKNLLLQYFQALRDRGRTHVALSGESKEILRSFYRQGKKPGTLLPMPGKEPSPHTSAKAEGTASPSSLRASGAPPVSGSTPLPEPLADPALPPAARISALAAQAEHWEPARSLGTLRQAMVFSTGSPEADLMLIGEAPGFHEERQREPFVGAAGQKLNDILKAMGLSREETYISNICKFRPAMRNQTTNNRKPTPAEIASCLPFVKAEITVVKPSCLVALGGTAAEGLLGIQSPVGRLRGQWHEFCGIPLRVTYHPSYLLHNDSALSEKRKVWDDMLAVMDKLGLPVSEKQKNFFR